MPKRRPKGEGSLYYNEKKKLWVAQINLEDGKTKTHYGKTQKEVRDWLLETRTARQRGLLLEEENITLSVFLDRYMTDVARHTLRPKTIEAYEYLVRMHIRPETGAIKLSALRPDHLQKLYSAKLDSGLSRRTVHFIHSVIHKVLDQTLKWGLVARNVAELVDAPTVKRKAPQTLSMEQAQAFLAHTRASRFYPMYALAIGCGLREGEVLGLHHEDIDWGSHTIHIRHAVQYLRPGAGADRAQNREGQTTDPAARFRLHGAPGSLRASALQTGVRLCHRQRYALFAAQPGARFQGAAGLSRAARDPLPRSAPHHRHAAAVQGSAPQGGTEDPGALADQLDHGHLLARDSHHAERGGGENERDVPNPW